MDCDGGENSPYPVLKNSKNSDVTDSVTDVLVQVITRVCSYFVELCASVLNQSINIF